MYNVHVHVYVHVQVHLGGLIPCIFVIVAQIINFFAFSYYLREETVPRDFYPIFWAPYI